MKYILIVFLLVGTAAFAQIPKPQKNTYVNDYAKVLTKAQIRALNTNIHKLERTSSVQLAMVLIKRLPKDYDIEDFALLIGRKWHVGRKGKGLIYVAAIDQHKQRLEVSRALESKFTDSIANTILADNKSYFRAENYGDGLQNMIHEISVVATPVSVKSQPLAKVSVKKEEENSIGAIIAYIGVGLFIIGLPLIIILYIIISIIEKRKRNKEIAADPAGYYNRNFNSNNYIQPANYSSGNSGMGSALGGFVAGAATGYAARTVQDHISDHSDNNYHHNNSNHHSNTSSLFSSNDNTDQADTVSNNDSDSNDWGRWNADDDSNDDNSSSSNSGYSGSGATSDW